MKKLVSVMLVLLIVLGMSCIAEPVDYTDPTQISAEPITARFFLTNDTNYSGDEVVWKTIEAYTNIKFEPIPVPLTSYDEKLSTTIASGDIPDIMGCRSYSTIDEFGPQGAFLSFEPYIEAGKMTNYVSMLEAYAPAMKLATSPDGQRYGAPRIYESPRMDEALLGRIDVLDKLGLSREPETWDEFYDIMLAVKAEYPESTPWVNRWGEGNMLYDWGELFATSYSYDILPGATEYVWGPESNEFKQMLVYLSNMYKDGLLNKDFATMGDEEYFEMWINNKGFFAFDYWLQDDAQIMDALSLCDEGFYISAMTEPANAEGYRKGYPVLLGYYGYTKAVSSTTDYPDEMIAFIDWTYSAQGRQALMFGVEGTDYTYDTEGNINLITDIKFAGNPDGAIEVHGLNDQNIFSTLPENAHAFYEVSGEATVEQASYITAHNLWQEPIYSARFYSQDEKDAYSEIKTPLNTFITEQALKVILGELSIDDWDGVVDTAINTYRAHEGLEMINKAYKETYGD